MITAPGEYASPLLFKDNEAWTSLFDSGREISTLGALYGAGFYELDGALLEIGKREKSYTAYVDLGKEALGGFALLTNVKSAFQDLFPEGAAISLQNSTIDNDEFTRLAVGKPRLHKTDLRNAFLAGHALAYEPDIVSITVHPDDLHGHGHEHSPQLATPDFVKCAASYVVNVAQHAVSDL